MARFKDINYEELGKYIRALIKDPAKIARIKAGEEDIKQELMAFMTPRDVPWSAITIRPNFDEATTVNIAFPFTGDVEASIEAIAPAVGDGDAYTFPDHYTRDPNAGTGEQRKQNRLKAYHSRIGDYVMARCK